MEKVNVEAIKARLLLLGFDDRLEEKLMGQICFSPPAFDVRFDKVVGEDSCTFFVRIEKVANGDFAVVNYSAYLRKGFVLNAATRAVADRMSKIDWSLLSFARVSSLMVVELSVLKDAFNLLQEVEKLSEASLVLYRYWAGTSLESLIPGVGVIKAKYELMQRFYVSREHPPITSDEAMRFLQNRWLEKAMQQSRVQQRQAESDTRTSGSKKTKKRVGKKK